MKISRKLIALGLSLFCAANLFALEGVVLSVTGKVEIQDGDDWIPLEEDDILEAGSVISTGFKSECVVALDETTITVKALTRLTLEQLFEQEGNKASTMYLDAGSISASVRSEEDKKVAFKVKTPAVTASVRGTDGDVYINRVEGRSGSWLLTPPEPRMTKEEIIQLAEMAKQILLRELGLANADSAASAEAEDGSDTASQDGSTEVAEADADATSDDSDTSTASDAESDTETAVAAADSESEGTDSATASADGDSTGTDTAVAAAGESVNDAAAGADTEPAAAADTAVAAATDSAASPATESAATETAVAQAPAAEPAATSSATASSGSAPAAGTTTAPAPATPAPAAPAAPAPAFDFNSYFSSLDQVGGVIVHQGETSTVATVSGGTFALNTPQQMAVESATSLGSSTSTPSSQESVAAAVPQTPAAVAPTPEVARKGTGTIIIKPVFKDPE